jgi:hypothetical protein
MNADRPTYFSPDRMRASVGTRDVRGRSGKRLDAPCPCVARDMGCPVACLPGLPDV